MSGDDFATNALYGGNGYPGWDGGDGGVRGADAIHDDRGNAYTPVDSLRLLDAFDVHVGRKDDGSGHAVIEPGSGKVLATGTTADQAGLGAQRLAARLGRRRLQAAIDGDAPLPSSWAGGAGPGDQAPAGSAPAPAWQPLYDAAARQGSDWHTVHHNGGALDQAQAMQQYTRLQQQLQRALEDPDTPDEARLPLATAGYQLFTGANIAGLVGPERIPGPAIEAAIGSMAFSGGGSVGPRVSGTSLTRGLLPQAGGTRPALTVGDEVGMGARPPLFRTPGPRPSNRADLHSDLVEKRFVARTPKSSDYRTYNHPDGREVTVKPSGEVIPTKPVKSSGGKRYSERTDYDFVRIPDQSHSTGHFVEPINREVK